MTVLGALVLVLAGAGTASATGGGQFLYRCLTLDHTDHFVSPSAECEGTTTEQVLGCTAPSDAPAGATVPLLRCFNGTDHLVSTDANCPTGYHQEQALGSVFTSAAAVTPGDPRPIFRCLSGSDHFESPDAHCEGQVLDTQIGFLSSTCAAPLPTPPPAPPSPPPATIVPGLPWPQGLQGHDDENWPAQLIQSGQTELLQRRYAQLGALKPGIRRYNIWWSAIETDGTPSSAAPMSCPSGLQLTPPNASEAVRLGYHRYHCYSSAALAKFDTILAMDRAIGAQNAAIVYSAPAWARHPNCTGFKFGPDWIKGGCVPHGPTALDDYEDFVNLLGARWGRGNSAARLSHFVVWNEVASAGWMDCSPMLPNRAGAVGQDPLTAAQMDQLVSTYAGLMRRTAAAVARHYDATAGAMVWGSFDRLWDRPIQAPGAVLHVGSKPFLDRLWPLLRTDFPWALAVHPYDDGDPRHAQMSGPRKQYTFADLPLIAAYQQQQLAALPAPAPPIDSSSFSLLFASEQGWPYPNCCDDDIRARNICYAQELAAGTPQVVGVTHNYFHDSPGGSQQGGQDYGLIAGNVTGDFANAAGYPTWEAYVATSAPRWGKDNNHYCCTEWQVGCTQ